MVFVRREERQSLHQLVTFANRYIAVVQALGRFAVHVEPPVAFQNCLIEQRRFRTQEGFHDQTIVRQRANVKHLK